MHDRRSEFDDIDAETPLQTSAVFRGQAPEIRQFGLSILLGLMVSAAFAFAVVRFLRLDGLFREYGRGFRQSPVTSSINLTLYVVIAWVCARSYRGLSLPTPPARRTWPLNGAFFGTLFGASLFGMTACFGLACLEHPVLCGGGMVAGCLLGGVWASVPALLLRAVMEPWRPKRSAVGGNTAFGALLGAATGLASVSPIALFSVIHFLSLGLVPAAVGAVCGARGAYLQSVAERHFDRPIRVTFEGVDESTGEASAVLDVETADRGAAPLE
jgi:hypothetical protein